MIEVGKKVGTPTGIHSMDPNNALERAEQGMQFIAVGSDLKLMSTEAQRVVDIVNPDSAAKDIARY